MVNDEVNADVQTKLYTKYNNFITMKFHHEEFGEIIYSKIILR